MQLTLITLFTALSSSVIAGTTQVNFYWDLNCQQFAGSNQISSTGQVVGGPYGSRSGLIVNFGHAGCSPTQSPDVYWTETSDPNSNSAGPITRTGQCFSGFSSIWAEGNCRQNGK